MTSMAYNSAAGLSGMLKEGHTSSTSVLLSSISAATELSRMVRSSLGPMGLTKLVVNHLEKLSVTSDCVTILQELEIQHPMAQLVELAAKRQSQECGDGTNACVCLTGALLEQSQDLVRQGLHASELVYGFQQALQRVEKMLLEQVCFTETEFTLESLTKLIAPVVGAKHYGHGETILAPLISRACLATMSSQKREVNPDSIRTVQVLGGHVSQSTLIHGYVAQRSVETSRTTVENKNENCKICVFGCGVEASSTEAKGTVLMKNAHDLQSYNVTEESKMEECIKSLADAGIHVVVTGGNVSEMALHFLERYQIMVLKIGSKWELRRLCQAVGATALVRLGPPTPDEIGTAQSVKVQTFGGRPMTVFACDANQPHQKLVTLVLRASTRSNLQDLERAVDNGVMAVRQACRNGNMVYGAGATEMALAVQLNEHADTCPGLEQYAIRAFSKALQVVPRALAENSGMDATHAISKLVAAHKNNNNSSMGIDVERQDVGDNHGKILDLYNTKWSAMQLAVDTTLTILQVDQIIMSKQSGGK